MNTSKTPLTVRISMGLFLMVLGAFAAFRLVVTLLVLLALPPILGAALLQLPVPSNAPLDAVRLAAFMDGAFLALLVLALAARARLQHRRAGAAHGPSGNTLP